MKLFTTLITLALVSGVFASELPVSYNASGPNNRGAGAFTLSSPLPSFQDPAPTPSTFGIAGYYSFCSKVPAAIAMQRIGGVNNFFGLHLNPDVSLMLGGDIDGIVRGGGSLTVAWTPKDSNLSFIGGLGADWPMTDFELRKVGIGLVLGLRYDVRF